MFEENDKLFAHPPKSFGLVDQDDYMYKQLQILGEEKVRTKLMPMNTVKLTNQAINDLREGLVEFVQIDTEPFIRTGRGVMSQSHGMAGGLNVKSAGELLVRVDQDGNKVIYGVRNKSGYYHPPVESLRTAIESLIDQGIRIASEFHIVTHAGDSVQDVVIKVQIK